MTPLIERIAEAIDNKSREYGDGKSFHQKFLNELAKAALTAMLESEEFKKALDALRFYSSAENRGLKRMGLFSGGDVYGDAILMDNGKLAAEALAPFLKEEK